MTPPKDPLTPPKKSSRLSQWGAQLVVATEKHIDRPWYFPVSMLLTALDHFVLVLPIDGMMITTVLLRPKKWLRTAIWFTIGVVIGAWLLGVLLHSAGDTVIPWIEARGFQLETWHRVEGWIQDYGFWGLALCALAPMPVQPGVFFAAIGHMNPSEIFAAVLAGRIVKYVLMCYIASHAPHLLKRLSGVNREVGEIKSVAKLP